MANNVFFVDLRVQNQSLLTRIGELVVAAGIRKATKKNGLTAVKIHFGERGNTAFVRPLFVQPIIEAVREAGGKPFLTDASTLYVGTRGNAVDHLRTAVLNGFAFSVLGAPLIIADGIDGRDEVAIPLALKHFETAYIGSAVVHADALVSVAHFKLHEASGFGGAIKNVGMGAASRRGKMAQHSDVAPKLFLEKCIGCGLCRDQCAHDAIHLEDRPADSPKPAPEVTRMAVIDQERCVGCARCIHTCPQGALGIDWAEDLVNFMEKMVEYTVGAIKDKEGRALYVNFVTQVSPACDCYPFADAPIVPDIGILASRDPVAIDQACMDLVNAQPALENSCLKDNPMASVDKVKAVYPHIDWEHQLRYAEQVGLGRRDYELTRL
ncbi:MAG: DUF362 domain-containing protein [Syntrophobacteraceae bacterium]